MGDDVTFVVNRNINFTNVCVKRCGFCAFSRCGWMGVLCFMCLVMIVFVHALDHMRTIFRMHGLRGKCGIVFFLERGEEGGGFSNNQDKIAR